MDDTTVAITGGTRGVGRAVTAAFVAEGAHVTLCARDGDDVEEVTAQVTDAAGAATGVRADVRDEYDVERFLETAARAGPSEGIDIVVANAGVNHGTPGEMPLHEEPYARFDDTMRTNVRGVFTTVKEASPHLREGARILVPSGAVARPDGVKPGMGAYAVSKAAAEALVRGFETDMEATAFVVDPGLVATDVTDGQGRDPEDVAEMFVWTATGADPEEHGGGVVDLRAWKKATR